MYRKKHSIYMVWYYLWFQASTGDLETYCLQIRGDYCNSYCFIKDFLSGTGYFLKKYIFLIFNIQKINLKNMVVKKCSDYLSSLVPPPCLLLQSQQFYPSLLLPYQHKCQPSEKGKKRSQYYYENTVNLTDSLKGSRGPADHTEHCRPRGSPAT